MVITIIISIITFILIMLSIMFFPCIKVRRIRIATYWIIALCSAILLIILKKVPLNIIFDSLTKNSAVNPLKILALFISMTFLSVVLDELGLFKWIAMKAVKYTSSSQLKLFLGLYFLTAILTIFTSNDIVVLTLTPFICFLCKNTKVNPIPYLIGEFMAANTYSMMLLIGNPTNIYLSTSMGINFTTYLKIMFLPTIACGAIEILLIMLVFHKSFSKKIEKVYEDVKINDKVETIISLCHLIICLIFLVLSSYINIEMWLISCICALSLLVVLLILKIFKRSDHTIYKSVFRLPFELIPFVLSMFVIIIALDYQNVTSNISSLLGDNNTIFTYGISSYLASNLINNIPMSMLYSNLIGFLEEEAAFKACFAAIIGSNVGAFLTPIGALAGIMFTSLTEIYDTKLSFRTFTKYGIIIGVPIILVSLLVLELIL